MGKTKPFQVIMDEQAHQNLKQKAKQLGMTKGDFVQNLHASFQYRVDKYRERMGFGVSIRSDELDVRIMKFIMFKDKSDLTADKIKLKLNKIKSDFEYLDYRPDITITDDNV